MIAEFLRDHVVEGAPAVGAQNKVIMDASNKQFGTRRRVSLQALPRDNRAYYRGDHDLTSAV